eukprot:8567341-Alexandrium_andersonii.AAC.1
MSASLVGSEMCIRDSATLCASLGLLCEFAQGGSGSETRTPADVRARACPEAPPPPFRKPLFAAPHAEMCKAAAGHPRPWVPKPCEVAHRGFGM